MKTDNTTRELIIFGAALVLVLVVAHLLDLFVFVVNFLDYHRETMFYIDELIIGLAVLSTGLFIFLLRKTVQLKKETAERMRLQEELLKHCQTEAETERIVSRQLHVEVEERKRSERGSGHKPHSR